MPLLLSVDQAGEMASDHHVRVIQHGIEPAPGGQQSLETNKTAKVSTACLQMCSVKNMRWEKWQILKPLMLCYLTNRKPNKDLLVQQNLFSATGDTTTVREQVSLHHLPSLVQIQPWQSVQSRHEHRGFVFSAFIFSLSLEGGSMDFKQLRFCKRIVLEDKRCLWRLSAGRREAAARNCKAGLSANSQAKSIEFSCW